MPEDSHGTRWTPWGTAVRLGALILAYYGLARLGLLFALPDGLASPIWPPAGLAIAAVALWGPRALPAIVAAAFIVEFGVSGSLGLSTALALGNTAEAAIGGWILRRAGGAKAFDSLPGVARFGAAIAAAPLVAATVGAASLFAFGSISQADLGRVWSTWYLGDAAGAIVVAPVLLLAPRLRFGSVGQGRAGETVSVVALLVACATLVFGLVPGIPAGHPALVILLMPPLVWGAFRLGPGPAAVGLLSLDTVAVLVTREGFGPFAAGRPNDAFLVLQAFVFAVGLMVLGLAALASERRIVALGLEARVRDRTVALEDLNARLRLEVEERARAQAAVDDAQHIAQVGSWRWDVTKPNADWSTELFRIYGLDPKTHVPTYPDYLTRVHPDDVERVKTATEAVFKDHKPYSHDERIRRTDGTWRNLHTWASAVLDDDGKLVSLLGVCQDITERVAAQGALQESLERFRALADAAPIGIVHTSATGEVDYVNDKWRQITGVRDHRDVEAMRKAVHPEDQPTMANLWRSCVKEGREFSADFRFVHPDGAVRWTSTKAVPVRDANGAMTGFVSTVEDITDRRATEAKDREVRRLREQAEFKTNFLRTAAHELGTPLTPIKIQMHILRGLLKGTHREEERKAAEILERNITRLQVLVQDMLESARLQSGKLRLSVRPTDLAQVVHEVVETFQEPAIHAGIALDTEGPNELPVVADPDRISQVLYNLLSNAMKFTPAGGHVGVSLRLEPGDRIRVTVRDTGSGFLPEQAAQLFQPFSQLEDPLQRVRNGSGLGLYISRGIVEQHGGTLEGSSQGTGKGAVFSFVLPRVAVPQPGPIATAEVPPTTIFARPPGKT
ncbi:MAG: sensor histidine kinase [Thermoplasmatota archaeon]